MSYIFWYYRLQRKGGGKGMSMTELNTTEEVLTIISWLECCPDCTDHDCPMCEDYKDDD